MFWQSATFEEPCSRAMLRSFVVRSRLLAPANQPFNAMHAASAPLLTLFVAVLLLAGCAADSDEAAGSRDSSAYADDMAAQHAGDSTNATAIAQEPAMPVESEMVSYGAESPGYMAQPARPDSMLAAMGQNTPAHLPGLMVVHEWWGLNDNVKTMARRLAGEGYRVLAVDLYGGQVAQSPAEARSLMQRATQGAQQPVANMEAAHNFLSSEQQAPRTAVLGWCFGGGMALNAALAMPTALDGAVIYYGRIQGAERGALARLDMPILAFFGGEDESIPVEDVRAFEETLNDLGKQASVTVYPNAGHAFANPTGQNYVADAAEDSWEQTTAFLQEQLYPQAGEGMSSSGQP